jgi:hypothetical protein
MSLILVNINWMRSSIVYYVMSNFILDPSLNIILRNSVAQNDWYIPSIMNLTLQCGENQVR